jgi:hypothetical protein
MVAALEPINNRLERYKDALEKIAELNEFRHGSGVYDYKPLHNAKTMQEIAWGALNPVKGEPIK